VVPQRPHRRSLRLPELHHTTEKETGAAGDLTIVRPQAAAPLRRPEQVEQARMLSSPPSSRGPTRRAHPKPTSWRCAQEALVEAEQKRKLQTLTAPVSGTVQQLAVHTIGGVVTPAQQLMVIVPAGDHLEAEVMISNRDIGFVDAGESAQVKIDTFNFTRYGLLHGIVLNVSQDAIVREKPATGKPGTSTQTAGALADTSEPQGQELVYAARITLDRTQMEIEGRLVNLAAGMAVTAEINPGHHRSVICLPPLV
jgi:HlyD family type I secretion membrane fusion protein